MHVFTFDVRIKTFLAAELGGWLVFHAIWVRAHQTRPRWPIPPCKVWRAIGRARVGVQQVICHHGHNTFFFYEAVQHSSNVVVGVVVGRRRVAAHPGELDT